MGVPAVAAVKRGPVHSLQRSLFREACAACSPTPHPCTAVSLDDVERLQLVSLEVISSAPPSLSCLEICLAHCTKGCRDGCLTARAVKIQSVCDRTPYHFQTVTMSMLHCTVYETFCDVVHEFKVYKWSLNGIGGM